MAKSIEERTKNIIAEQLGVRVDEVKPVTSLIYELKMDDLDKIEIIMALEEEFGIEIPDEDAEKFINVANIVTYIEGKEKKE